MLRHFTVSAFVSVDTATGGATLLHFHALNRMWLPAGGHVEPDEDSVQATLRETKEETGLDVEILPTSEPLPYEQPPQLPAPVTIMVEDIADHPIDGRHQHIDQIYFTRPRVAGAELPAVPEGWIWVDAAALRSDSPISPQPDAEPVAIPEDVRVLGLAAIERAARG
jgi:8-oxo-dGTP pyrophosphatase MutT (NUDIX family)